MSLTPTEQSRRRTFGAGVAEGLRLAGIHPQGNLMNASKLARIESGLNGMARKVLEVVPIQAPWSKDQIAAELRRTGSNAGRDVLEGCLATLADRGVVKEPRPGQFIRVIARQPEPTTEESPVQTTATVHPIAAAPAPAATDTLSRLANLGALLRRAADEADALALDVEARVQAVGKDAQKLRQLQALLKEIGE